MNVAEEEKSLNDRSRARGSETVGGPVKTGERRGGTQRVKETGRGEQNEKYRIHVTHNRQQ